MSARARRGGIRLRRFPYPYAAALAIANDAEYLTPRSFWDIHTFLNTTEHTPLGEGLGLQVTDSAFMYTVDPGRSFSYFEGTSERPSRDAGWLRELMRAGCIDVLHAYGDFDGVGGCTRRHAAIALEELAQHDIALRAWSNHGTVENTQNVGGAEAYYQRGDEPGAPEYHADLLLDYGIRFLWLDTGATNRFGQEGPTPWREAALAALRGRRRRFVRAALAENRLLEAARLRDGREVYLFRRYRGPRRPDPAALPDQLSERHLDGLVEAGAVSVVYQHLGCDRRSGSCEPNVSPYFSSDELAALRRLAGYHHGGRILVTGVGKLLRYWAVRRALRWREQDETVVIEGLDDPILGGLEEADLEGITFEVPAPERAEIRMGERALPVERHPGCVMVPLRSWTLPERPRALR